MDLKQNKKAEILSQESNREPQHPQANTQPLISQLVSATILQGICHIHRHRTSMLDLFRLKVIFVKGKRVANESKMNVGCCRQKYFFMKIVFFLVSAAISDQTVSFVFSVAIKRWKQSRPESPQQFQKNNQNLTFSFFLRHRKSGALKSFIDLRFKKWSVLSLLILG